MQKMSLAGVAGSSGYKNGPATSAQFSHPTGVALDGDTLFVADELNHVIRVIVGGQVQLVAGDPKADPQLGPQDGAAEQARFNAPHDVALDGKGGLYVADCGNSRLRRIDLTTRQVTTVAGTAWGCTDGPAKEAAMACAIALAVDSGGRVYIADFHNNRIRLYNP